MKAVCVLCLFIVAVTYAASVPPLPANGRCQPGKSYKVDCNTCVCGNDGRPGACTLAACIGRNKRETQGAAECSGTETTQRACNTCYCVKGQWACGRLECEEDAAKRPLPPVPADGICVPKDSYMAKDGCNTCTCLPDGKLGCTDKVCPPRSKRSPGHQNCAVGETKREDCNDCRCVEFPNGDRDFVCTRKACPDTDFRTRRETSRCEVGDKRKVDCNHCNCIALPSGEKDWDCTKNECEEPEVRKRRDVGVTSDLKNTPCAPNDFFQLDCNTCYCNSAKTGYLCTEHICPPDNTTDTSINSTTRSEAIPDNISTTLRTTTTNVIYCNTKPPLHSTSNPTSTTTVLPIGGDYTNSTEDQIQKNPTLSTNITTLVENSNSSNNNENSTQDKNLITSDTVG